MRLVHREVAQTRVLESVNDLQQTLLKGLVVRQEQVGDPLRVGLLLQT